MGEKLSGQKHPSSLPKVDILAEAGKIATAALKVSLRAEVDDATSRAQGCGCPNCKRDLITVFDRVNDVASSTDGGIKHEPTLATGTGAVRARGFVPWIDNVPPDEWHIIRFADRPHGSVSSDEDHGGID